MCYKKWGPKDNYFAGFSHHHMVIMSAHTHVHR